MRSDMRSEDEIVISVISVWKAHIMLRYQMTEDQVELYLQFLIKNNLAEISGDKIIIR